jgi:DNA-binding transcriptional regulator YhcF (GntR family)
VINFDQSTPLYIQIMQKIKADIVSGKLKGGDKIPSVRDISESFKVNPNTVQRALIELEREGITYPQRGIGTFVCEGLDVANLLKTTLAMGYAKRFTDEMIELGLSENEMIECIKKVLEGRQDENT